MNHRFLRTSPKTPLVATDFLKRRKSFCLGSPVRNTTLTKLAPPNYFEEPEYFRSDLLSNQNHQDKLKRNEKDLVEEPNPKKPPLLRPGLTSWPEPTPPNL